MGGIENRISLALPLRHSRVSLYAVRNSSHLCTGGLCSATLSRLSSALWSKTISEIGTQLRKAGGGQPEKHLARAVQ